MPHTTHAYLFELKVLDFAEGLSASLAGNNGGKSFVITFDADGSARNLQFECPDNAWHELTKRLDEEGTAYLFYDPFDAPEHIWLSWRLFPRSAMERMIGEPFKAEDFVKARHLGARAPELEAPDVYPASWGVMF